MGPNAIFFGWNRSVPGRERLSGEHFEEFLGYLGGLKQKGTIETYEPVLLEPHGGDMNGFFLIRGDASKLDGLVATQEWQSHMVRAGMHLQGSGAVRGYMGNLINEMMGIWQQHIPA
jgi:hypothetical protein